MWFDVAFGPTKTGLSTVGYRQYNATGGDAVARTTTGVQEIGQGAYGVDVTPDSNAVGLEWDTGESAPLYAHESLYAAVDSDDLADSILDRTDGVETGYTLREAQRLILSAAAGKANGLEGTTANYRDVNDSKNRITATVDTNGNRTSIAHDVS